MKRRISAGVARLKFSGMRGVRKQLVVRKQVLRDLRQPADMERNARLRSELADEWEPTRPEEDPRFVRRPKGDSVETRPVSINCTEHASE